MSKTDLSPEKLDTLRVSRILTTVLTANGSLHTTEEARVCVKDLDMFVTVSAAPRMIHQQCFLEAGCVTKTDTLVRWKTGSTTRSHQ